MTDREGREGASEEVEAMFRVSFHRRIETMRRQQKEFNDHLQAQIDELRDKLKGLGGV